MRAEGGISYPLKGFALILRSVFGPKALKKDKVTRVDKDSAKIKSRKGGLMQGIGHMTQNATRETSHASASPQN